MFHVFDRVVVQLGIKFNMSKWFFDKKFRVIMNHKLMLHL